MNPHDKRSFSVYLDDGSVLHSRPETNEDINKLYALLGSDNSQARIIGSEEDLVFLIPVNKITYVEIQVEEGCAD